jgi:hypothetical protein
MPLCDFHARGKSIALSGATCDHGYPVGKVALSFLRKIMASDTDPDTTTKKALQMQGFFKSFITVPV